MTSELLNHQLRARRLALSVMVIAVTYQAVLCLIHTQLFPVSRAMVGMAEVLLLLACIPMLLPRLIPQVVIFMALSGALLCLLALLSGHLDVKVFRDLLIILWFYWLGRNLGDTALADQGLRIVAVMLVAFGLLELLALDTFTDLFNIFGYYVSIGSLEPVTEYVRDSRLQMNGIRPDGIGRTLLPGLLDNHRVSSLFLEPVSLGNFATILAAWGLSKERAELGSMLFFLGAAMLLIVLADSRFALISVSLLVAMRVLLRGGWMYLVVLLPVVILLALVLTALYANIPYSDSYAGRLMISGLSLVNFSVPALLGFDSQAAFPDQGYAYVLSGFGLVLAVALWLALWLVPGADSQGHRFRCYVAVYVCLILAVSGTSLFAFKTAAVLWLLLGVVVRKPASVPAMEKAGNRRVSAVPDDRNLHPSGFSGTGKVPV